MVDVIEKVVHTFFTSHIDVIFFLFSPSQYKTLQIRLSRKMKKERMADIKIRVKIVKKEYLLDAQQHIGKEYDVYNIHNVE